MSTRYTCAIDVDSIVAVDVHTHGEVDGCWHYSLPDELRA